MQRKCKLPRRPLEEGRTVTDSNTAQAKGPEDLVLGNTMVMERIEPHNGSLCVMGHQGRRHANAVESELYQIRKLLTMQYHVSMAISGSLFAKEQLATALIETLRGRADMRLISSGKS